MILALCFFLSGALVGIYMLIRHLQRRPLPRLAAVLHGLAGATGFGILLATIVQAPGLVFARYALIVFIAAILLGVVNVLFHIRGKRHRTILILVHGLTAVVGALTLVYGIILAFGNESASASDKAVPSASAPSPSTSPSVVEVASTKPPVSAQPQATAAPSASTTPSATASAAKPPTEAPANATPTGPAWTDKALTFYEASAVLSPSARTGLADIAKDLLKHTEITLVEVQGYADERGGDAYNLDLTRGRASAVVNALVAAGVQRSRLRSAGYGASCPADANCQTASAPASCHQPSAWQQDRRVVLLVLESGGQRFHGKVACDRAAGLVPAEDQAYSQ